MVLYAGSSSLLHNKEYRKGSGKENVGDTHLHTQDNTDAPTMAPAATHVHCMGRQGTSVD